MTAPGDPYDPFRSAREETGWVDAEVDGTAFTMFLRHADVRRICRDYATFRSVTHLGMPWEILHVWVVDVAAAVPPPAWGRRTDVY